MNPSRETIGNFIDAVVVDPAAAKAMLEAEPRLRDARWVLDETVLHFLAIEGTADHVRRLCEWGFDPNAVNQFGATALVDVARLDRLETAQALLDHGADPNASSTTCESILGTAVRKGNAALVALLLDRGADPNAPSDVGGRVLGDAIRAGDAAIVELLLTGGADPLYVTQFGETIFDASECADGERRASVESALARHGVHRP